MRLSLIQRFPWLLASWLAAALSAAALSAEEQMQFADGIFLRGLHDMAAQEYLQVLRDHPSYAQLDAALFRLAECYRQLGNKAAAERFYKRVITEFPSGTYRFRAEFRRAELFAAGGQYLEAVSLFQGLLSAHPPPDIQASSLYFLGYSLDKLRLQVEAEKNFLTVIQDHPESPFASYACLALAEIYHRVGGRENDLRELYEKAWEKPATPRVGAEALYQAAELAFRERDYSRSAHFYEQLIRSYPSDYRVNEARLHAAWSYHNAGHVQDALDLAEETLKVPELERRDEWLYIKANCERRLEKMDKALQTYAQLIREFPDSPSSALAVYESALMDFQEKRYAGVLARSAHPSWSPEIAEDFLWMAAESRHALNQKDPARKAYEQFLHDYPQSERAASAMYRLAAMDQAASQWKRAGEQYRKLAEKHPGDDLAPEALFAAAWCASRDGQLEQSIQDWSALETKYPEHQRVEEARFQKALAEMQVGRTNEALSGFERLLEQHPETERAAQAHYWMGVLHDQAGAPEQAEQSFKASLKSAPESVEAPAIQYRLAGIIQKRGRMDEAASLLQDLLDRPARPDMPPSLLEWLARHWLAQKEYDKAAQAARIFAEGAPSPEWKQIAWCLEGAAQQGAGREKEARKAFEKALQQEAHTAEGASAAFQLAGLDRQAGKQDSSAALYQKAAELASAPELLELRARSYAGLGQLAADREDWNQAARYFMSVAVLFDDPVLVPECLASAASAFEKLGREEDRQKTLAELKQRYPESPWSQNESRMEHQSEK